MQKVVFRNERFGKSLRDKTISFYHSNYFWFVFQRHNLYALRYWGCECLCLINIIVQMYCMNKFFDGEFLNYGLRVMNYSEQAQEDRVDPMVYVFPRVTKCIFHKYGNNVTINLFNQLNFVQHRSFWKHPETRQHLHSTSKHCQWKNVHFHLVLVYDLSEHADRFGHIPDSNNCNAENQTKNPPCQAS